MPAWYSRNSRLASVLPRVESGDWRIDIIEFVTIARTLEQDPVELLKKFVQRRSRRN
jgi:hypothetical protein